MPERRAVQATGALLWILWFQVSARAPVPVPRLFPTYDTCIAYTATMDNRAVSAPGGEAQGTPSTTVRFWCAQTDDDEA